MKQLWEVSYFIRAWRARMRHGELSRAPLELLRIEVRDEEAECDWMARPPDPWDRDLARHQSRQLASDQALRDAIGISELLFEALPEIQTGILRAYRRSLHEPPKLIISGKLRRGVGPMVKTYSLAMRAKLHGLRFWLDDGVLVSRSEESEEETLNLITSS